MKKNFILWFVFLLLMSFTACMAEEDELPEGLFIYTPTEGKMLSWVETEKGNEYQIIGLAPPDSTLHLEILSESKTIWQTEIMSEGNGYFIAAVPSDNLDPTLAYSLKARSLSYDAAVNFTVYEGSLADFALDPLHIEILGDLPDDERALYEGDITRLQEQTFEKEEPESGDLAVGEVLNTGPNEYRNKEYSYRILEDGTAQLIYYYGHKKHLNLPTIVDGYEVSALSFDTFNKAGGVLSVTIPSGIKEIKHNPFFSWESLTAIYAPKDSAYFTSVNGILYSRDLRTAVAVPGNHPDKEIEIPYGITRLGISCFFNSTIRKVHLPESLRTIDDICFEHTHRLIELVIPDSVRVLGAGMLFASAIRHLMIPSGAAVMKNICPGCSRLEEITVMPGNETVCSIDGVLFTADQEKLLTYPANKDLQEYTVPFGTVTIDQVAFKDTLNLRNVILPESVTELGYYAFVNSGITSITIPDSCRVIDEGVFSGCMNLKEFIVSPTHPCLDAIDGKYLYSKDHTIFYCFPDGLTETMFVLEPETKTIRSAAFGSSLMEIRLPEGLEEIGQGVFFATKIKSLYIPGTVKSIGMQAFSFCHELETVGIGEGVEEIADRAFHGSKKLKGVSIPASVKQIDGLAFSDTENVVIYTPEGSYAHQYAVQNQLKVETAPGAYEVFTQNVRDGIEISPVGGAACKVRIKKGTTANIREKPDMDSRRVGRGKAGDEFTWLETVEKDGTTWYKVELEDGAAGYVHAKMSELIEL